MKAILLKTDGTSVEVMPENGTDFQLPELYALIGCSMIEILSLYNGKIMVIDEEGKLKNDFVVNKYATELYHYGKRKMSEQEIVEHYNKRFGVNDFCYVDLAKESGLPEEVADAIVGNALVCEASMVK